MKPDVFYKVPFSSSAFQAVKEALQFSEQQATELFQLGAVYLDGNRIFDFQTNVNKDQVFRIFPNPRRFSVDQLNLEQVLFEDSQFVVIDKPADIPSVPVASNYLESALGRTQVLLKTKLYPVHRLDESTFGVLTFAKNPESAAKFQNWQKQKALTKIYRAVTNKPVPQGIYTHWLSKGIGKMLASEKKGEKKAITEVIECKHLENSYLLTIKLHTGRTHQIRCQLAALGAPILGDTIYGGSSNQQLALQAWQLKTPSFELQSQLPLNLN